MGHLFCCTHAKLHHPSNNFALSWKKNKNDWPRLWLQCSSEVLYRVCPTWHDDIREAQFPGDGHTPREEDHVLSPQLLDVSVQELERHGQTWRERNDKVSNTIVRYYSHNIVLGLTLEKKTGNIFTSMTSPPTSELDSYRCLLVFAYAGRADIPIYTLTKCRQPVSHPHKFFLWTGNSP